MVERTEGWPAGLYFGALALNAGGEEAVLGLPFAGDDRMVAEYLRSELLERLSPEQVTFLTRTSVLDRMCGPMCDAVLEAEGSADILRSLEDSNLLLVALDRKREWYRYHHLFRELLHAELERREPELVGPLHLRAATWSDAQGYRELALEHAQRGGDTERGRGPDPGARTTHVGQRSYRHRAALDGLDRARRADRAVAGRRRARRARSTRCSAAPSTPNAG